MPSAHPLSELLLDLAAGALEEPYALAVASHVALCADCRDDMRLLEDLGGILLEDLAPVAMSDTSLESTLRKIAADPGSARLTQAVKTQAVGDLSSQPVVPAPLQPYIGNELTDLPWRHWLPGLSVINLPSTGDEIFIRLLRLGPGRSIPRHKHEGEEMTVVLQGAYQDQGICYTRGDFQRVEGSVDHRPRTFGEDDCICLVVTDAPIHLTGPLGRMANPFLKI